MEARRMSGDVRYAIVEIMGHRRRPGLMSEVMVAGAKFIRIEHPTAPDHTGEEPLSEMYSPAAVFSIVPCTKDEATEVAGWAWPDPRAVKGELVAAPIRADWDGYDRYETVDSGSEYDADGAER